MNGCFPDWNWEEEDYGSFHNVPSTTHNKVSMSADQGPIELVWQDGHVIVQDQKNLRNTSTVTNEPKQPGKPEVASKCGGSSTNPSDFYLDVDETAPWFQNPSEDANFSKEFCSEPFKSSSMRPVGETNKLERETPFSRNKSGFVKDDDAEGLLQVVTQKSSNSKFQPDDQNPMPPPQSSSQPVKISSKAKNTESGIVNFSHFSRPWRPNSGYSSGCKEVERNMVETKQNSRHGEPSLAQSSKLSGGIAFRGSTQMQEHPEPVIQRITNVKSPAEGGEHRNKANERGHSVILRDRATAASPSAGSGTSAGTSNCANPNAVDHHRKRKGRDDENQLDWESEETEFHSAAEVGKPLQGCTSRRSRAAEVHNLSERRRRDKINEKMKALQELIPHCNKTDKASMLDEAIEYLKALQLQVQMMWMGNGMAPMMFPGAQHYLPFRSTMPVPIPGAFQVPPLVFGNQTMCPTSTPTQFQSSAYSNNTTNQSQNSSIPEAFLRHLMLQNMQQSQEGMKKMFGPPPYASQPMQPNYSTMPSMSSGSPINGPHPLKDNRNE